MTNDKDEKKDSIPDRLPMTDEKARISETSDEDPRGNEGDDSDE